MSEEKLERQPAKEKVEKSKVEKLDEETLDAVIGATGDPVKGNDTPKEMSFRFR